MNINKDKGGRPKIWHLETTAVWLPKKYAKALIEIALEWQQNEDIHKLDK